MIAPATLPEPGLDRNRIRDSMAALRLGHDGLEQFVALLFDEFDTIREKLDDEQMRLDEQRHELREAEAQIDAERSQWETDRQHWHDALQKRVVELEQDRLSLTAELEAERRRTSEMAQAAADQHRQFVAERAEWAAELRDLRQMIRGEAAVKLSGPPPRKDETPVDALHADEEALKVDLKRIEAATSHPVEMLIPAAVRSKPAASKPAVDPVLGPLLSQFQQLQKDVARRREKKH